MGRASHVPMRDALVGCSSNILVSFPLSVISWVNFVYILRHFSLHGWGAITVIYKIKIHQTSNINFKPYMLVRSANNSISHTEQHKEDIKHNECIVILLFVWFDCSCLLVGWLFRGFLQNQCKLKQGATEVVYTYDVIVGGGWGGYCILKVDTRKGSVRDKKERGEGVG